LDLLDGNGDQEWRRIRHGGAVIDSLELIVRQRVFPRSPPIENRKGAMVGAVRPVAGLVESLREGRALSAWIS